MAKYDWEAVRVQYVRGFKEDYGRRRYPSMGELAATFDIPHDSIRRRAAFECWTAHRRKARAKYEAEADAARIATMRELGLTPKIRAPRRHCHKSWDKTQTNLLPSATEIREVRGPAPANAHPQVGSAPSHIDPRYFAY